MKQTHLTALKINIQRGFFQFQIPSSTHVLFSRLLSSPRWCKHRWNYVYCVTPVWPSNDIWRRRFLWTLVPAIACCQTATTHYLTQYWLTINGDLGRSKGINFADAVMISIHKMILTHWGQMTHICASKLTIIGSDYVWPVGTKIHLYSPPTK